MEACPLSSCSPLCTSCVIQCACACVQAIPLQAMLTAAGRWLEEVSAQ